MTLATAVATFFLWRVTAVLAVETKRMADVAAQPMVVVSIVSNQWALTFADLVVENTGNASAFDISIQFTPPLLVDADRDPERSVPLKAISVLKPGQSITSYLNKLHKIIDKDYTVSISWLRHPNSKDRELLTYVICVDDHKGMTTLGSSSPTVQIAQQIKKMREDWQKIANGQNKIRAEIFSSDDREREQRHLEKRLRQIRKQQKSIDPG
jgi:hypothetical protein